ncbi:MAG: polysaccharide export protein [Tabrizicola sp.]|jgi:polysaccharide export outer membrane protein|nr:polysaccharide export protein [Tabrizicola sp.]
MIRLVRSLCAMVICAVVAVSAMTSEISAQEGYKIRPGDVLRIEVLEDPSLNRTALVSPDGSISFPLAGGVPAAGRTLAQLQSDLASRISGNFAATPSVFVALEQVAPPRALGGNGTKAAALIEVFVMGEAANPGKLEVKRGTTLLQVFAQMGGFSPFAATKRVQLHRDGKITTLSYDAIEQGTSAAGATIVQDGDVIVVPQRKLFE